MNYSRNRNQNPHQNTANVLVYLHHVGYQAWTEEFSGRQMIVGSDGKVRPLKDLDAHKLRYQIQSQSEMPTITRDAVETGLAVYCDERRRNSVRDFITNVEWDGTKRIELFMNMAFGAPANAYTQAVSKNFWRSMVARVLDPGCQVDTMVVLEGLQGLGKSTALRAIAGEYYGTSGSDFGHKDFLQCLEGKLIVEIEELDSFRRTKDVRTIKRIISTPRDTYRASYGHRAEDFDRRCIFVGTTNDDEYLQDATGGRRFWPIEVSGVDLNFIEDNRRQLFAEAVHDFKAGETWWDVPVEAKDVQQSRTEIDPWTDVVTDYIAKTPAPNGFTSEEILVGCLNFDIGQIHHGLVKRVGDILRLAGLENPQVRQTGRRIRRWRRKPPQLSLLSQNRDNQMSQENDKDNE